MKRGLMAFKHRGDRAQDSVPLPQDRQFRDGEVLPRNQCKRDRSQRAENLRNENDPFAAESIC